MRMRDYMCKKHRKNTLGRLDSPYNNRLFLGNDS